MADLQQPGLDWMGHEEIQTDWVSMCTRAHSHKWGNQSPAAGHTSAETSVQLLKGPSTYAPVTDLHPDQLDEDMRCKQSCLGLPWMLSGSICADTYGHDHVLISAAPHWVPTEKAHSCCVQGGPDSTDLQHLTSTRHRWRYKIQEHKQNCMHRYP